MTRRRRTTGTMQLTIPTSRPFSFDQTLAFLERFPPCRGEYILDEGTLTAAVSVQGRPHAFTLSGHRAGLAVEVAADLPAATRDEIVRHASGFVGAKDAVAAFYEFARKKKPMSRLV